MAIRAAAPDLVELTMKPLLAAMERFGLVTLRRLTMPLARSAAMSAVRGLIEPLLRDAPV
jgi:hypothetical protein